MQDYPRLIYIWSPAAREVCGDLPVVWFAGGVWPSHHLFSAVARENLLKWHVLRRPYLFGNCLSCLFPISLSTPNIC
jgi:hypothetical protein